MKSTFYQVLICAVLLGLYMQAQAQERHIKAYVGTETGSIHYPLNQLNTDTGVVFSLQRIGKPGFWLAYAYQTPKKNVQEWGIGFSFLKDQVVDFLSDSLWAYPEPFIYAGNSFNYRLAGQFEQRYLLNKQAQNSRFYLGLIGAISYDHFRFKPRESFYYPHYGFNLGLEAGCTFHYNLIVFNYLQMDVGLDYSPIKFQYNYFVAENPAFSSTQQKINDDAELAVFQRTRWAFRIGFGIPLSPQAASEPDKK